MRARIEQALRELPLSEPDIATLAAAIASSFLLRDGKLANPDWSFFCFRDKATAVVDHFADHGLTPADYLQAVVKQPSIFHLSPGTIIANVEAVAAHFTGDGLTLRGYLRAAVKQPQLFYQSPATLIANVEPVAAHFTGEGLTLRDYLRAAVNRPPLFCLSPATVIAKIEDVAERFATAGLTRKGYLGAALTQPALFTLAPATVQANIAGVLEHFADDGLTPRDYLRAAVKQPQLFYQSPATLIGNVNRIIDMYRQGMLHFPGQAEAPPDQPLQPMFAYLVKNPIYLCLADDSYRLRITYVRVTGRRPRGTALLTRSRSQIERDLASAMALDKRRRLRR